MFSEASRGLSIRTARLYNLYGEVARVVITELCIEMRGLKEIIWPFEPVSPKTMQHFTNKKPLNFVGIFDLAVRLANKLSQQRAASCRQLVYSERIRFARPFEQQNDSST